MKYRILVVRMLRGPVRSEDLSLKERSSVKVLKAKGLADYLPDQLRYKRGPWQLTPKGATRASQWDYDLKLNNRHPDQDISASIPVSSGIELTMDESGMVTEVRGRNVISYDQEDREIKIEGAPIGFPKSVDAADLIRSRSEDISQAISDTDWFYGDYWLKRHVDLLEKLVSNQAYESN